MRRGWLCHTPHVCEHGGTTRAFDRRFYDERGEVARLIEPSRGMLELGRPENADNLIDVAQSGGDRLGVAPFAPDIENLHEPPRGCGNRLRPLYRSHAVWPAWVDSSCI